MKYHTFGEPERWDTAILIKESSFHKGDIQYHYIDKLQAHMNTDEVIAYTLEYQGGKAPVRLCKDHCAKLLPVLDSLGVKYLYVADAAYFKVLAGQRKAEQHLGYKFPCVIPGFEHMTVVLGVNHSSLIHNPDNVNKLNLSINTLIDVKNDDYEELGKNLIHSAHYPDTVSEVKKALDGLMEKPFLAVDIETFSLNPFNAGIGTIAFAWDHHNGLAFPVDYTTSYNHSQEIRKLLLEFFKNYKGKYRWHNAGYDVKVLIYQLMMSNPLDRAGMLDGLHLMTKNIDDTMIITYLATNTTAGNKLGLKERAHEFAGNYAKDDIKDITKIPLKELLEYNLVDTLCTNYVYDKFYPVMVADKQEDIYKTLMLPSLKLLLQVELTGLPMEDARILEVKEQLLTYSQEASKKVAEHPLVKLALLIIKDRKLTATNAKLKTKVHKIDIYDDLEFNMNSPDQLQVLLYEVIGLPVIELTDTKQPACGSKVIKKLINHIDDQSIKDLLQAVRDFLGVDKILGTFITAFENGTVKDDGMRYLHGSFKIGGTVSGRLSSSNPNLQNLPSGSTYGKLIKTIFKAADGWVFAGADFASLEDRINTLLTQDPNKLKVYTDGYDGHSLRAHGYFGNQMLDILMASEDEECYSVDYEGKTYHFTEHEEINYKGEIMTGKEFYELLTC